jgi:hypothetical protein
MTAYRVPLKKLENDIFVEKKLKEMVRFLSIITEK